MTLRTYEITFGGEAVPAIVAAFEDFQVIEGRETTTLRRALWTSPPWMEPSLGCNRWAWNCAGHTL